MMKRILTILLILLPLIAVGQNKKAQALFDRATEAAARGDNDAAALALRKTLDADPSFTEAQLLLGTVELRRGNNEAAAHEYETYQTMKGRNSLWDKEADLGLRTARFRHNAILNPVPFKPINLGPNVNTADDEYLPSLTADDHTLIFTRRLPRRNSTTAETPYEEDFYISQYDTMELGWGPAARMAEPLNSTDNEGAQTISFDGRIMIFTACNRRDGHGRCDLYISVRRGDKWGRPRNLGSVVNSSAWEAQPSLSVDGRTLYFVSNRRGGYGGSDIWETHYVDGHWTTPRNLGPVINTPGDETAPFIHFDNRTLYFASTGHIGMGGSDLFISRRVDDTTWGEPKNLGYPLNTLADENNLIVSPDGRTALFSSDRYEGYGRQDLYSFILPPDRRPTAVHYIEPLTAEAPLMRPGDTLTLRNVFFETAKATLVETSQAELDRLAELLLDHTEINIEIGGHTDSTGTVEGNRVLSEQRAKAVRDYLVERGVATSRLSYRGHGSSCPLATNATPEGRALNRRTTITRR
ncbi:MAG: OmpA family protein [Bacteroidales bacterium]|nr:OmpA family protein [Bacteroidales bacterium]